MIIVEGKPRKLVADTGKAFKLRGSIYKPVKTIEMTWASVKQQDVEETEFTPALFDNIYIPDKMTTEQINTTYEEITGKAEDIKEDLLEEIYKVKL